ncbi:PIN domain-containing protein [Methylocystis sp. SC2]|uniref:PIN domain-containing protein n=1 Tax=Methylocystis sp. (strain SC2) TaxID=187303 RepID=UPI0005A53981|nr:PIN domain-containing protein [Methylocystis sp. SC2]
MYLLDTQQVMDLFSRDAARPVFQWLEETRPGKSDLFVSVISLGQIAHAIEDMGVTQRNHWRRLYQEGRRDFEQSGGVIDVDAAIVDVWQAGLRGDRLIDVPDADDELGEDDRLIFATAIARGYALVTNGSRQLQDIAERTTLSMIEI